MNFQNREGKQSNKGMNDITSPRRRTQRTKRPTQILPKTAAHAAKSEVRKVKSKDCLYRETGESRLFTALETILN